MHLTTLVALAGVLLAAAVPAEAQDRARTKEVDRRLRRGAALAPAEHHRGLDDQQPARAHVRPPRGPGRQGLQAGPDARHGLEDRQRHHVGVHAAPGRQVPQRRALQCRIRQGHHGLHQGPGEQDALCAALGPGEGRPGGQRLHRALHHREAVARLDRPHRRHRLSADAAQGAQASRASRPSPPSPSAPGRSVRAVGARREARDGEEPRLLAGRPRSEPRDHPLHPRVQRAAGRAARRRDRHHEGRAAAHRGDARQERQGQGAEHGVLADQLPGPRQPEARPDAGPARAPGDSPCRRTSTS